MSRKPSAETELRAARRQLKGLRAGYDGLVRDANAFRLRAIQAEAGAAEWKRRFDLLLEKGFKTQEPRP